MSNSWVAAAGEEQTAVPHGRNHEAANRRHALPDHTSDVGRQPSRVVIPSKSYRIPTLGHLEEPENLLREKQTILRGTPFDWRLITRHRVGSAMTGRLAIGAWLPQMPDADVIHAHDLGADGLWMQKCVDDGGDLRLLTGRSPKRNVRRL